MPKNAFGLGVLSALYSALPLASTPEIARSLSQQPPSSGARTSRSTPLSHDRAPRFARTECIRHNPH